ncbi:MAG: serine hydrolase domain-containing protein [Syntrophobacter sp.]
MIRAMSVKFVFLCLFSFFSFIGPVGPGLASSAVPKLSGAPDGTFPTVALQELLDKAVARGIPGAVMGIATPDGAWFTASGVANMNTGELISPHHAMRLASVTETFTAALIWSLIENGPLTLDQKVNRWLTPGLVPKGGAITIGMLLNHTSGLRDHTESPKFTRKMRRNPNYQWSAEDVLAITRGQALKFTPGTQYAYSSTNDYILGLIAQAATGRTVKTLLLERFFSPNGMDRTALRRAGVLPSMNTPGYVWQDYGISPGIVGSWNFSGYWTAGAGTSTAHDMLAWASGLVGGKVLKPETLQQVLHVQSPSMMGYGFEVTRNGLGYQRMGRTGAKPGATTDFLIYPERGWVLFIGFNISDSRSAPTLSTRRIIRETRDAAELLLGWNVEPAYAQTIASGRAAIQQMLIDACGASAMVGLIDGERIVWSEGFGVIDKTSNTPPTADTLYAIGSTSKLFAGLAAMKLVEQGKLNLDTPITSYLPDFKMASAKYTQITPRMLLNHSAGFPGGDYRGDSTYAARPDFADQVMQSLATERLKYAPGEMATYCNDCFTMIGPVVESVSEGKTYPQFVNDELLAPLGITNTRYALGPFPSGTYAPYFPCANPPVVGDTPEPQIYTNPQGAGGVYSTANDMARLAMMLVNGGSYGGVRVLSESSVAEIGRDQTLELAINPVPSENYGLGLDWVTYPGLDAVGVRAWAKPGGAAGYTTEFIVAPDEGLGIIITGVSMGFDASKLAEQILLQALVERGSIPNFPEKLADLKLAEKQVTKAELAAIAGDYAESYKYHRVDAMPDRTLKVTTYMGIGGALTPLTVAAGLKMRVNGTFSGDDAPNISYRVLSAGGRTYLAQNVPAFTGHYRMESIIGQRITRGAPLSAAWRSRVGQQWLVVNDVPTSVWLARGTPRFTIYALDSLPGYVFAAGQPMLAPSNIVDPSGSDMLARMFLKVPMGGGRDMNDLVIETRGSEEWVRFGSTVYRPKAGVPVLPAGASTVNIGSEGYAEWRLLPSTGTIAITGAAAWRLYDSNLELIGSGTSADVTVGAADSYLMLFGAASTGLDLTYTAY